MVLLTCAVLHDELDHFSRHSGNMFGSHYLCVARSVCAHLCHFVDTCTSSTTSVTPIVLSVGVHVCVRVVVSIGRDMLNVMGKVHGSRPNGHHDRLCSWRRWFTTQKDGAYENSSFIFRNDCKRWHVRGAATAAPGRVEGDLSFHHSSTAHITTIRLRLWQTLERPRRRLKTHPFGLWKSYVMWWRWSTVKETNADALLHFLWF